MATDAARRAAHAFHDVVVEVFRATGRPTTQTAVASLVGESRMAFADCLAGRKGSLDRVHLWLVTASTVPWFPPLELVTSAAGVEVRVGSRRTARDGASGTPKGRRTRDPRRGAIVAGNKATGEGS